MSDASRINKRRMMTGVVVSVKMEKTVKVIVERKCIHAKYGKVVNKRTSAMAHNDKLDLYVGDTVKIMESRPMSKTKRWIVVSIEKSAKGIVYD
ncbi:MAG: 30S ribosomal protein S17 [Chlamydiia bacterium]|nr:30S ribosomal protein S17 [Chlamydiia bacterium]